MTSKELEALTAQMIGKWVYASGPNFGLKFFVTDSGFRSLDNWLISDRSALCPFRPVDEKIVAEIEDIRPIVPSPTERVLSNHFFPNGAS